MAKSRKENAFASWFDQWSGGGVASIQSTLDSKKRNIQNCKQNITRYTDLLVKYQIEDNLDNFQSCGNYIQSYHKTIEQNEKEIALLEERLKVQVTKTGTTDYDAIFKEMLQHKQVNNALVQNGKLVVITRPINNHGADFGRYKIAIEPRAPEPYFIVFQNLDYHYPGHAHPHVNADGKPCLDQYYPPLLLMKQKSLLYDFIDGLIQFLTVPTGDNGAYIGRDNYLEGRRKI